MPQPEFTREELHRIESNAEVTRDAALLRQLDEFERRFSERDPRSERITSQERLSRAVARELMAEVAHRESAERLANFNERGDVQPLVIESKDGRISVHRLKEIRPYSVVERVLRPFIEKSDTREIRHAIEAASANSQSSGSPASLALSWLVNRVTTQPPCRGTHPLLSEAEFD
jgi:hypothetical protein